jgi:hypothetical protein
MTERLQADTQYQQRAQRDVQQWRAKLLQQPGMLSWVTGRLQAKVNSYIPEKAHAAITTVIKQMTQAVLTGSEFVAQLPLLEGSLEMRERLVAQKVEAYRTTAAVEGGIAGAGGFVLAMVDFPALLSIKLKLLFDIAALYGHSCADFRERLYLLQVFQLAFSSQQHRRKVFLEVEQWQSQIERLPRSLDDFDWRTYQQEYRNYIDLAKLVQLIPVVGAPVGAAVNYHLVQQLGDTARNAYRLRWFAALPTR